MIYDIFIDLEHFKKKLEIIILCAYIIYTIYIYKHDDDVEKNKQHITIKIY